MTRPECLVSCLLAMLLCASASLSAGLTLYISPKGNDKANGLSASPGKAGGPFRTLERARDEIRARKQAGTLPVGPITVELAAGIYERDAAFALEEQDSGTAEAPITYRAKPGAEVRIVGGKVVKGWQTVTDPATLDRLDPAARGKVVVTDLKAQGITDYGKPGGGWASGAVLRLELFYNNEPMGLARWPNEGFVRVKDVTDEKPVDVRGTKGSKAAKFIYDGDRPERWLKMGEKDVWLQGWWFWDWAEERQRIASIDPERKLITLEEPPVHPYGYRKGQWYYAYNALCELDQAGEWFLDRENGLLYFWPPQPLAQSVATVSLIPNLLTMKQVSHVTLRGLTFETCRATGITMSGGTENRIVACVVRNTGSYAINMGGGTKNGVVGCDTYNMGDGGVIVDAGDRKTLTHAENFVDNCHIHHYSRWNRIIKPGIGLYGCGNRATHNLIHDAPHKGMLFGGNDHLIEFNEFHSVVYEANDAGVIYAGYDWTMRGHEIRYNYFHDIYGFEGRGCVGVYLDDMFSSAHIHSNVFYRVPRAAFIGGGHDTTIENNIFVDCKPAIHVDARALGWASGSYDTLVSRLKAMPYETEPWRTRYPQLLTILDHEPMRPQGNIVARNICVGGRWDEVDAKARPGVMFIDNLLDQDPQLVGAKKLADPKAFPVATDFALKPQSPALKLGFKPLPVAQMGLYQSPDRASWPVRHTVRTKERDILDAAAKGATASPAGGAPRGPLATLKVSRCGSADPRVTAPTADGDLKPEEWGGEAKVVVLEQGLDGGKVAPASRAWLLHDGRCLYVAVDNTVNKDQPLQTKDEWGGSDAVELAFRSLSGASAPILVLRGYPNGAFHSDDEAGAPAAAVKQAAAGVVYRCKVLGPDRWVTEWQIPLASLGIDPSKQPKFFFSLTVRKSGGPTWVQWQGTRDKCTWQADNAGTLELGR
ncbi:right-handed parallel beta-helix repeat-containing protein [bacterium]|nr:right-handed parallel beta-helix repeat-containing protein [bacterium]